MFFAAPDDVTVYLVVNDYGKLGRAFVETDIAEADRETVLRNFVTGQYSNALQVVAFNTAEGWSRDVSEDIAGELLERAVEGDDNLAEDTKRFIERHVNLGDKRPPARSVRRPEAGKQRQLAESETSALPIRNPACRRLGYDKAICERPIGRNRRRGLLRIGRCSKAIEQSRKEPGERQSRSRAQKLRAVTVTAPAAIFGCRS
jgi:hypothetical protein